MGDHRGNLLLPSGTSCLACGAQADSVSALWAHLARLRKNGAEQNPAPYPEQRKRAVQER